MELLNRYLNAVRFWLPSTRQDDILEELSEDMQSQIEEKEAALGRKLNETEMVEFLKQRGDPMIVAGRFLPEQHLIGPPWFPLYMFVLKLVLLWILLPLFILMAGGAVLLNSHNRAIAFLDTLGGFWMGALSAFATITIVFAVLDRFHHKLYEKQWDPRKLPAVPKPRDPRKIPRAGSIAELIWGLIFILWWVGVLHVPYIPGNAVQVAMAPVWRYFYWPILLFSVSGVALASANLFRPWWSWWRAAIRLSIDAAMVVISCLLMRMGPWVDINSLTLPKERIEELRRITDSGLSITFMIIAAIGIIACVQDVRRLIPAKVPRHPVVRSL